MWIAFRRGLLAVTVTGLIFMLSLAYPLTFDLSAWYARGSIVFLIVVIGLAVYGFVTATAKRPLIQDVLAS
jgi:hypothetical protein